MSRIWEYTGKYRSIHRRERNSMQSYVFCPPTLQALFSIVMDNLNFAETLVVRY